MLVEQQAYKNPDLASPKGSPLEDLAYCGVFWKIGQLNKN